MGRQCVMVFLLVVASLFVLGLSQSVVVGASGAQVGSAGPQATVDPNHSPGDRIILATYNMNYGVRDKAALARYVKIIRKAHPDVLAIQEGNAALFAFLKKVLAREYPHMLFYPDSRRGPGGFAWLSKFPLQKAVVLPRSFGWFTTPMVRVRLGTRELLLVNVHLRATIPPKKADFKTMLQEFIVTEKIRAKEIRFIHSRMPAGLPTVILGDFNTISTLNVPTFLRANGFADSFASAWANADSHPSWHWFRDGKQWRFRIDYIWHNACFKTVTSRILAEGPSDHYPVVSELKLIPAQPRTSTTQPAASSASPDRRNP